MSNPPRVLTQPQWDRVLRMRYREHFNGSENDWFHYLMGDHEDAEADSLSAAILQGEAITPDHARALELLDRASGLLRKPERDAAQEQDALADEIDAFFTPTGPEATR